MILGLYLSRRGNSVRPDSHATPAAALPAESLADPAPMVPAASPREERQPLPAEPPPDAKIDPGLPTSHKVFVLEGRILDMRGTAIPDCLLETDAWHSPEVRSAADGGFRLEVPYVSGSSLPTQLVYRGPRTPAASSLLALSVAEQAGRRAYREVVAEDGHLVTLRVTDASFREVPDALVSLASGEQESGTLASYDLPGLVGRNRRRIRARVPCGWGITDDQGRVTVPLLEGVYRVEAWKTGFLPFESPGLEVPSLEEVRIQLEEGRALAGAIHGVGLPLVGADVCVEDRRRKYFTTTDELGEFHVGGLEGDEVTVLAWQSGFPVCRWKQQKTGVFCDFEMCTGTELLVTLVDGTTHREVTGPARVLVETGRDLPHHWLEFTRPLKNGVLHLQELGSYASSVLLRCPGYEPSRMESEDFEALYGESIVLTPLRTCRVFVKDKDTAAVLPQVALQVNRVQWEDSESARRASQDMFGVVDIPFLFTADRLEAKDKVTLEISRDGYSGKSVLLREPGGALPEEILVELDPWR